MTNKPQRFQPVGLIETGLIDSHLIKTYKESGGEDLMVLGGKSKLEDAAIRLACSPVGDRIYEQIDDSYNPETDNAAELPLLFGVAITDHCVKLLQCIKTVEEELVNNQLGQGDGSSADPKAEIQPGGDSDIVVFREGDDDGEQGGTAGSDPAAS